MTAVLEQKQDTRHEVRLLAIEIEQLRALIAQRGGRDADLEVQLRRTIALRKRLMESCSSRNAKTPQCRPKH